MPQLLRSASFFNIWGQCDSFSEGDHYFVYTLSYSNRSARLQHRVAVGPDRWWTMPEDLSFSSRMTDSSPRRYRPQLPAIRSERDQDPALPPVLKELEPRPPSSLLPQNGYPSNHPALRQLQPNPPQPWPRTILPTLATKQWRMFWLLPQMLDCNTPPLSPSQD